MFDIAERLPAIPQPQLPGVPDFAGPLARLQAAIDQFAATVHQINTGLAVTGFWVGAVTVAVLWFISTRYQSQSK